MAQSESGGNENDGRAGQRHGAGQVPALNIERIYSTTVPAEELARALADHFRVQEFEAQVFSTSGDRTVMQARKESLWRHVLGVSYALTVVFTPVQELTLCPPLAGGRSARVAELLTPARGRINVRSEQRGQIRIASAEEFVGRDLPGGLLVTAGQEEVLTAGCEVRREPAADVAGADDGHRAVRNGHLAPPFVT